jgi:hypothetical protein
MTQFYIKPTQWSVSTSLCVSEQLLHSYPPLTVFVLQ